MGKEKDIFSSLGASRLLKLATHLESNELGHKHFDFTCWNRLSIKDDPYYDPKEKYKKNGCGTVGCAIGECPIVFDKHWRFGRGTSHQPFLKGIESTSVEDSITKWFRLTGQEARLLFIPGAERYKTINRIRIHKLGGNATPKQVARNIRKFVKAKGF